MAFLKPANLQCLSLHYEGSVDNLTDIILGVTRVPMEIFYIDVLMIDADDTYDATTITLEHQDVGGGDDTEIAALGVAANTGTQVIDAFDADDLTEGTVAADQEIIMTVDNVGTGADTGVIIQIWYIPTDAPNV